MHQLRGALLLTVYPWNCHWLCTLKWHHQLVFFFLWSFFLKCRLVALKKHVLIFQTLFKVTYYSLQLTGGETCCSMRQVIFVTGRPTVWYSPVLAWTPQTAGKLNHFYMMKYKRKEDSFAHRCKVFNQLFAFIYSSSVSFTLGIHRAAVDLPAILGTLGVSFCINKT